MTTVHANAPRDAINRLVAMVGMAGIAFSEYVVTQTLARALHLIIHLSRGVDGKRRVVSISEITGTEGNVITMQEIFLFNQRGVDANGNVVGDMIRTGIRPHCMDKIQRAGAAGNIA